MLVSPKVPSRPPKTPAANALGLLLSVSSARDVIKRSKASSPKRVRSKSTDQVSHNESFSLLPPRASCNMHRSWSGARPAELHRLISTLLAYLATDRPGLPAWVDWLVSHVTTGGCRSARSSTLMSRFSPLRSGRGVIGSMTSWHRDPTDQAGSSWASKKDHIVVFASTALLCGPKALITAEGIVGPPGHSWPSPVRA